ncbi:MAG: WG repeat-containing protein [Acidobacteriota bacterium]
MNQIRLNIATSPVHPGHRAHPAAQHRHRAPPRPRPNGADHQWRLSPGFDELGVFDGGIAAASLNGKAGFVSPEGEWVVAPRFDRSHRFVGDLAVVQTGDKYSHV